MLPYAGYVDPESTLAIGVHHDGHLEATERTFCSLYHTFMFGFHPFAPGPHSTRAVGLKMMNKKYILKPGVRRACVRKQ